MGLPCFRRRVAFEDKQDRVLRTTELKSLLLSFGAIRRQRQLVQPFLELRGRLRHCRARGGPMPCLSAVDDGFFDKAGLAIVMREEFRLDVL
jgi:hypothetical protein